MEPFSRVTLFCFDAKSQKNTTALQYHQTKTLPHLYDKSLMYRRTYVCLYMFGSDQTGFKDVVFLYFC